MVVRREARWRAISHPSARRLSLLAAQRPVNGGSGHGPSAAAGAAASSSRRGGGAVGGEHRERSADGLVRPLPPPSPPPSRGEPSGSCGGGTTTAAAVGAASPPHDSASHASPPATAPTPPQPLDEPRQEQQSGSRSGRSRRVVLAIDGRYTQSVNLVCWARRHLLHSSDRLVLAHTMLQPAHATEKQARAQPSLLPVPPSTRQGNDASGLLRPRAPPRGPPRRGRWGSASTSSPGWTLSSAAAPSSRCSTSARRDEWAVRVIPSRSSACCAPALLRRGARGPAGECRATATQQMSVG